MARAVPPNVQYYFEATQEIRFINLVTTRVVRWRLQPTHELAMASLYRNKACAPFTFPITFR